MPESETTRIRIKGDFTAGGVTMENTELIVTSTAISTSATILAEEYHFTPNDCVAFQVVSNGKRIQIQHTVPSYSEKIFFDPVISTEQTLRIIEGCRFQACANTDDVPLREGWIFNPKIAIPLVVIGLAMGLLDHVLGWSLIGTMSGNHYFPLGSCTFFGIALAIRYVQPLQAILIAPDRSIHEILPSLNLIVMGLSFIASISLLVASGIQETFSFPLSLAALWGVGWLMQYFQSNRNHE